MKVMSKKLSASAYSCNPHTREAAREGVPRLGAQPGELTFTFQASEKPSLKKRMVGDA